ncbi:MAG TPA: hypothetical protein VHG09_02885, partial [Longimicrobiales bacterium]|nr:hypothetical protein [Longimicrobiales bacterium]
VSDRERSSLALAALGRRAACAGEGGAVKVTDQERVEVVLDLCRDIWGDPQTARVHLEALIKADRVAFTLLEELADAIATEQARSSRRDLWLRAYRRGAPK